MLKNIDTLGEEIRKKIENKNKKNHVINLLKENYYDTVNSITFVESLEKGKIPNTIHIDALIAIAEDLEIENLGRFFVLDEKDKIIREKDIEIAYLKKELKKFTKERK